MGGSGGGYYTRRELDQLRNEARKRLEQTRIDADVNDLLQSELATINDRDAETINRRLNEISEVLEEDGLDIERIVYGGSITKHTYVDGISDVDSLVLLDDTSTDLTPEQAKNKVHDAIVARLSQGDVAEVQVGNLAVTVTYRDGTVVQLLPAVRSGDGFAIASANGQDLVSHRAPQVPPIADSSERETRRCTCASDQARKGDPRTQVGRRPPFGLSRRDLGDCCIRGL